LTDDAWPDDRDRIGGYLSLGDARLGSVSGFTMRIGVV
jgi:hypothetical protein